MCSRRWTNWPSGRVDVAGLSLGGMVGMWLAAHRPERIGRLALLCTGAYLPFGQNYAERAGTVRERGLALIADAVVGRWVTPALAERDPDVVQRLTAMLVATDAESYAQCCEAIAGMDQRADLARIAAPTLVIGGAEDLAIPAEHQQALADEIPGARLELLSPAAHLAPVEQPGRIAQLLIAHFGGGATVAARVRHPAGRSRRRARRPRDRRHDRIHRAVPGVPHPLRVG